MLDKIRGQTVMKLMQRNAQEHAHDPALYSSPTHQYKVLNSMTWQEVHQSAAQLAAFLLKRKITKQTVLVMSRNRPEHFIADLAALYAQNTPASIYTTTLASEQIADIIKVTHASCIIIDDIEMYTTVLSKLYNPYPIAPYSFSWRPIRKNISTRLAGLLQYARVALVLHTTKKRLIKLYPTLLQKTWLVLSLPQAQLVSPKAPC